jgi:hypothetical protein
MFAILVFYDSGCNLEKTPVFLSTLRGKCAYDNWLIIFNSLKELEDKNDILENMKKEIRNIPQDNIYIFVHNIDKIKNMGLQYKLLIDYSTGDPFYEEMWKGIKKSKNCKELTETLKYWIEFYKFDPIKRLKHRFINSFQSLSIDLARLIELINENDIAGLKEHLKYLSEYWKERNEGPLNKLVNFWYALVGKDGLRWGEGSLPAKPDVPLSHKKGKELTIYIHLEELFGAEKTQKMQEWVDLLHHCQLDQVCDGKFDINGNVSDIYMKIKELEQSISKMLLCKKEIEKLRANSEYFINWLNELNELIEALIKPCS